MAKKIKSTKKKKSVADKILQNLDSSFENSLKVGEVNDDIPYYIPFKHKGLQYITGGVPGGCFTECHGDSQTGKSFLLYELGLETINMGGWYLQFDVERAYNSKFGKRLGLESSEKFVKNKSVEMQKIFALSKSFINNIRKYDKKCPILVGLDSYPPIQIKISEKELKGQLKNPNDPKELKGYYAGQKNQLFGRLLGDFTTFLKKTDSTLMILNQSRKQIGLVFGDPITTNAEEIIKYYATLRLRGFLGSKLKHVDLKKVIGRTTTWHTIKNRNIEPFMNVKVNIKYKTGLEPYSGFIQLLVDEGRIEKLKEKEGNKTLYKYKSVKFTSGAINKLLDKYPELTKYEE